MLLTGQPSSPMTEEPSIPGTALQLKEPKEEQATLPAQDMEALQELGQALELVQEQEQDWPQALESQAATLHPLDQATQANRDPATPQASLQAASLDSQASVTLVRLVPPMASSRLQA